MGKTLVIAEKPSVARDIAKTLGYPAKEDTSLGKTMWFPGQSGIWSLWRNRKPMT